MSAGGGGLVSAGGGGLVSAGGGGLVSAGGGGLVSAGGGYGKLSIIGVGMRSHSGVAAKMFEALSKGGINIVMISTSEIKTAVIIDDENMLQLAHHSSTTRN